MRKFVIGCGWFTIINFVLGFVGGASYSILTGARGAAAGAAAGQEFSNKYILIISLVSILIAVIGTLAGWLPYTKDEDNRG